MAGFVSIVESNLCYFLVEHFGFRWIFSSVQRNDFPDYAIGSFIPKLSLICSQEKNRRIRSVSNKSATFSMVKGEAARVGLRSGYDGMLCGNERKGKISQEKEASQALGTSHVGYNIKNTTRWLNAISTINTVIYYYYTLLHIIRQTFYFYSNEISKFKF